MPIRINLLAEAQAAEEMRRKDPVKRAMWIGVLLVLMMLAWSSSLQMKAMLARGELARIESDLSSRTNEFRSVLDQQQQLKDINHKLLSLTSLATNRLLYGTMLDALQRTVVPNVELVRMRADQSYRYTEAVKPKTNASGTITPARPAKATERILLTLEARDTGPVPGDQVNAYRAALIGYPYFQQAIATNEVRLANLSAPQVGPDGKPFVLFTLECKYPEVTR